MSTAFSVLASVIAFFLTTSSAGLATSPAAGVLLIEGVLSGKALRIVVDEVSAEAEVTLGEDRHFLDLTAGKAHRIDADGSIHAAEMAAGRPVPNPRSCLGGRDRRSPAIRPSTTSCSSMERCCGELLISPWMKPFVDPAVEALSILERVKGGGGIEPSGLEGACAELPFSSYAQAGWPLMAGSIDRPIFKTETISFNYEPRAGELDRALH